LLPWLLPTVVFAVYWLCCFSFHWSLRMAYIHKYKHVPHPNCAQSTLTATGKIKALLLLASACCHS
jgi:hypothetical protein